MLVLATAGLLSAGIIYEDVEYTETNMPYNYAGTTETYIVVSGTIDSYSSDKMSVFEINGVSMTGNASLPSPENGKQYFIHLIGNNKNASASINGTNDWSQPEMTVTPATLTGFTADPDTPSSEQSFTVSGQFLMSDISLSAPANYEISVSSGSDFSSSITLTPSDGTIGSTIIYVRLKSGLSVGTYNGEDITISTSGASDETVTLSGVVQIPDPSVTVSPTTLTGFVAESDTTSLEQSFTVSGQDLTADISLSAPGSYEISTSPGSGFGSSITLTPNVGTVPTTTIYVRLKSGLPAGTYNGEGITISTSGAGDETVTCSGEVIEDPSPYINVSPSSLSEFNYTSGNGPSSEYTFTVIGQYLTSDISLSAPTNYEISLNSGSDFSSSITLMPSDGTVNLTTIYVRLKSGLFAGSYNDEYITISSADIIDATVTLSGVVQIPDPSVTVSPTSLTGFTADPVTPSAEQSFTVSGQHLTSDISLNAAAGYEISTSSGSGFASSLTLTPGGGTVSSTTIYVRLRSGLSSGSYDGDITISTDGASNQTVTCSGIVEIPTVINWNGNDYTVTQMSYSYRGNTEYYIVVSGTDISYSSDALDIFEINGVDMNTVSELPDPVDGKKYFIHFKGSRGNSTFSIDGTNDWSQPYITVSPGTLSGFSYIAGNGPSSEYTFTVSGQDLTSDISLNAPAGYEISATSGSGFGSSLTLTPGGGTVNTTAIYVRLRSGLSAGTYDGEIITVSSVGASELTVVLSGVVENPSPVMTVSPTSLSGFTAQPDAPSLELSFTVSGQYLTSDISLNAPADYEISLTSGSGFGPSFDLIPSGGTVSSATIYVRLKSGLSVGSYDENITISTAGAGDQTVTCSGDVIENLSPSLTLGPASLSGFSYKTGSGPSPEYTFTVGGQALVSDIILSAPSSYEISATSGSGFGSGLTLTQSGGMVSSTTIYVRLKAGLSVGSYNGENILISTDGASDQTVICSGIVEDLSPSILVSPATLTGFTAEPSTPSPEQNFTVSGQELTSNISISAPASYEISITSGSGFGSSLTLTPNAGTVNPTTVYVRLRSGLPEGSYDGENITVSSDGTEDQTVTCSGDVEISTVVSWNGNNYTFVEMPYIYEGGNVTRIYTYGKITSFSTNSFMTSLEINGQSYAVNQTHTDAPASIDQKYFITITPKNQKGHFEINGETKNMIYTLNIKVLLEGAL